MAFELRAIDRSRLSTSIAEQLVEAIRSGGYPPGTALPAERALAEQLGVSRGSVREAIRVLEHTGLLDVRTGSGTFVREDALSNVSLLRLQAASVGEDSPLDVMVARRALEPTCAELAARSHTEYDIKVLRESVDRQTELVAAGAETQDVDLSFHRAIAAASHNPVLEVLVERLVEIMGQDTWRQLKSLSRMRHGGAEMFLEQHRQILLAVERSDAAGSAQSMTEHLDSIEQSLLVGVEH